jgi:hypothetical protein
VRLMEKGVHLALPGPAVGSRALGRCNEQFRNMFKRVRSF